MRRDRGSCKTCAHPERARIELELANGVGCPKVAKKYGSVSRDSLWRHWRRHVSEKQRAALKLRGLTDSRVDVEALRQSESESLLQNLTIERVRLVRIADAAEAANNYTDATRAASAIVRTQEIIAKILGELRVGRTEIHQTFLMSADWFKLRSILASALRPFPAAQAAVLKALREYEHGQGADINAARAIELRPPLEQKMEAT